MNVQVYWNRTRKLWSIRDAVTRRVIGHEKTYALYNARFVVNHSGIDRIRERARRTVVAWVVGENQGENMGPGHSWSQVVFDPFKHRFFTLLGTGGLIMGAGVVVFKSDGTLWVGMS